MQNISNSEGTVYFVTEAVFLRDAQQNIWSADVYTPNSWDYLLEVFESVRIVARVKEVAYPAPQDRVFKNNQISFICLPFYKGSIHFLLAAKTLLPTIWKLSSTISSALISLPGPLGLILAIFMRLRRRKYAVMLVGDIFEVLAQSNFSLLVRLAKWPLLWLTQYAVKNASVVRYVTSKTLQHRYPCSQNAREFAFSDVKLDESSFAKYPKYLTGLPPVVHAAFCGSLAQRYKGLDLLIVALDDLKKQNIILQLSVAGDGIYREEMENLSKKLGLTKNIKFLGLLPKDRVLSLFSASDIFVMPSRTEGLPRALIEAMAQGLPCIGSKVGGIPELISEAALFEPNDVEALKTKLLLFVKSSDLMNSEAARNLKFAKEQFLPAGLVQQRLAFLNEVKWLFTVSDK